MSTNYGRIPAGFEDELEYVEQCAENLSLKIRFVPDCTIGACLNGENFDRSLSSDVADWFRNYKDHWNSYKRTPHANQSLKTVLLKDEAPLLLALKLFANCPGCNNLKNNNLPLCILETISDLYKENPNVAASCDDNTRMIAFNLVKTCGIVQLYRSVMTTYELQKICLLLVPKLRELVAQSYFKDAAYWAIFLNVTDVFDVFEIVFPLILQDKVFLAEEYLAAAREQQLQTVKFLDSLLDNKKTVMHHCDEILAKYNFDIKHDVLSYRPMSKLVTRLAKKYKIDEQHTPNLVFSKARSYLHYLHRKYLEGGMSRESWRELVNDSATTEALQLDLIASTFAHGDLNEAVYWARYFKVPPADCPPAVEQRLQQTLLSVTDAEVDSVNQASIASVAEDSGVVATSGNEFLTLTLSVDCILLIDSKEKFLDMMSYLEVQELIAFDSEWKPTHSSNVVVSLLQLATLERVFLVDCQSPAIDDDLWMILGKNILNNLEILKIGFSINQDLQMLQKSLPQLQMNLQITSGFLDLRELWRRLQYMQIVNLPYVSRRGVGGQSLSALTEVCLGKKLDKSNQCSNWAKRPLRSDQIIYAALDAHCLLQIYNVFSDTLQRVDINIVELVDEITTYKRGPLVRTRRNMPARKGAALNDRSQSNVANAEAVAGDSSAAGSSGGTCDMKLICDNMLVHVARELRKMGLDTVQIFDAADIPHYVQLAKRENRIVLSRSDRWNAFARDLSPTKCILIPEDTCLNQTLNVVALLGITVQERDLYTRCSSCNSTTFILATRDEMQMMCLGHLLGVERNQPPATQPNDKSFQLLKSNEHIIRTKTTNRGKSIKYQRIKPAVLRSKHYFYICDNCGCCTWEGAYPLHWAVLNAVGCGSQQNANRTLN